MRKSTSYAIFSAFAVLFAQQNFAMAQNAPAGLRGKTVVLNWGENKTVIVPGGGTRADITSQTLTVYVSDKGQVFARRTVSNRKSSADQNTLGNASGKTLAATQFRGRSMSFTWGAVSEGFVRRFGVEFDEGFTGCSATVIAGLAGGRTAIIADKIHNTKIEVQAVSATGPSCSVREGNAFL